MVRNGELCGVLPMNGTMHEHRWLFPGPWRRASLVLLRKAWQILRGETSGGTWNKGIDPWISLIRVSFLRISANLWWRGPWDAVMPHRRREDKLRFLRKSGEILAVSHNGFFLQNHLNFHHSKFYFGAPCLHFSHFKGVLGIEDIVVLAACDAIAESLLWPLTIPTRTYHLCYQSIVNSPSRCSPFHLKIWASNWSLSIHQQVKRHAQCRCCISAGPRTFCSTWLTRVGSNCTVPHSQTESPDTPPHHTHASPETSQDVNLGEVTMKSHGFLIKKNFIYQASSFQTLRDPWRKPSESRMFQLL